MENYTKENLEAKTVRELRRLVVELGIVGFTKKPKATIINAIMSKMGDDDSASISVPPGTEASAEIAPKSPEKLSGVEATFQSSITKPELKPGERLSTTVQVACGASSGRFPVVGRTVAEVGEFLREVLNVDKLSTGLVNGKEVSGDYKLKIGDNLEFLKPAGKKG